MEPVIRVARPGDRDALAELVRHYRAFDGLPFDPVQVRRALGEMLRDPSLGQAWLIHDGDQAVGYLALTFGFSLEYHGRDAWLDEVFILESHRGRGLGSKAMALAEAHAREVGARFIHLEVTRPNAAAMRLYERGGYQRHEHYLMTKWIGMKTTDTES